MTREWRPRRKYHIPQIGGMTEVGIVGLVLFWLAIGFAMAIAGMALYYSAAVCGVIWTLIWAVILTYAFVDALKKGRRGGETIPVLER